MPLPDGGGPWPPKRLAPVYERIATWAAWYGGNPDELAAVYGGASAGRDTTGFFASERGGIRGAVRNLVDRWWWGTRPSPGEQRSKLHIPLAGDIATTSADLLFSEPPTLTVENKTTQGRLDQLVDDRMHSALIEAAEIAAGMGGVYLRIVWAKKVAAAPWLAAVHADAAVPEFLHGRLTAVTFWRVLADDGSTVLRHLERHEPGSILHGVYQGTTDDLGHAVPLTEHPDTATLAEGVVDGNRIPTGAPDRLTACYVPNMRPARCWRNIPAAGYLGRADIQGSEPLLDALDESWSSWMRDLRLAKARLIMPREYLRSNGPGRGASADLDRELYVGLDMLPGKDEPAAGPITMVQFAIRVEEHAATCTALTEAIVRGSGYSAQSFGLTGEVAMTATESNARERRSMVTRRKKTVYWRPELAELVETLLIVDAALFASGATPELPDIEFGDSVQEGTAEIAQTLALLEQARAISTEMKVRMQHPDWDDPQIKAEVERITKESGLGPLQDPGTFTGGTPATADEPSQGDAG